MQTVLVRRFPARKTNRTADIHSIMTDPTRCNATALLRVLCTRAMNRCLISSLGANGATRRNISEDTILHSHRRENLKSYKQIKLRGLYFAREIYRLSRRRLSVKLVLTTAGRGVWGAEHSGSPRPLVSVFKTWSLKSKYFNQKTLCTENDMYSNSSISVRVFVAAVTFPHSHRLTTIGEYTWRHGLMGGIYEVLRCDGLRWHGIWTHLRKVSFRRTKDDVGRFIDIQT
jgi:hypothetical protein